jgi:hypothetical protein
VKELTVTYRVVPPRDIFMMDAEADYQCERSSKSQRGGELPVWIETSVLCKAKELYRRGSYCCYEVKSL